MKAYYSFRNSSSIGTSYRIQSSTDGVTWVDRSAIVVERFARFASPVTARYWRVVAKNIYTSTQNFEIYGIQLFEAIPPTELVSRSLTADVSPSTARFFLRAGSITLDEGPDVSGNMSVEISRDGGANWTAASLTLLQEMVDSFHIYWTGDVDLSAQPAGTEMTFHLTTLADKPTFKTAAILEWSDA